MADSPYGVTLFQTKTGVLGTQILTNLNGVGSGLWMREQLSWSQIEQTQGVYTWTKLDADVQACNAAGINFLFPIQNAPNFYNSVNPATGVDNYPTTQSNWLPNAANFSTFVQAVMNRYYPGSPNGYFNAIQIGNEEWDTANPRDIQSLWYEPVAAASFPLIRATYPNAPILLCALRKTPTSAISHYTNWLTNLYTSLSFVPTGPWGQDTHYYRSIGAGPGPDPKTSDSNTPDIGTAVATILSVIQNLGYNPQLWIGECGWDVAHKSSDTYYTDTLPVTQDQQRQYCIDMLNIALAKGASKVLFYTDVTSNVWNNTTLPFSSSDATPTACVVATGDSKSMSATIAGSYTLLPVYSSPSNTGWKEYATRNPTLPIKHGVLFAHA